MSKRTRNIIIVVVLLLLVAALVAYLLTRPPAQGQAVVMPADIVADINQRLGGSLDKTVSANVNEASEQPPADTPVPVAPAKPDEGAALKRLASAFAERFGSFSNQSGYENLTDLKSFMSPAMAKWAEDYVAEALAKGQVNPEYFGMVTRSITAEVLKLDETAGTAKIAVTTQRREVSSTGQELLYYQVINIDFVKSDDTWKVNAAKWGDKVDSG